MRRRCGAVLLGVLLAIVGAAVEAQQIYRWTDENGQVHFGNQPPRNARQAVAQDRQRSDIEIECEAAARSECQEYVAKWGKYRTSQTYRECFEHHRSTCERVRPRVKPTAAPERVISTPTLEFDPDRGESLRCEMRCPTNCRGRVEIRSDRVLKRGENLGIDLYQMDFAPLQSGSAFCTASTQHNDVRVVFSVLRGGSITSSVEGQ